jgi:hypothetical protein
MSGKALGLVALENDVAYIQNKLTSRVSINLKDNFLKNVKVVDLIYFDVAVALRPLKSRPLKCMPLQYSF